MTVDDVHRASKRFVSSSLNDAVDEVVVVVMQGVLQEWLFIVSPFPATWFRFVP